MIIKTYLLCVGLPEEKKPGYFKKSIAGYICFDMISCVYDDFSYDLTYKKVSFYSKSACIGFNKSVLFRKQ